MRVRLDIAAIFVAVGLGALTVTLLHRPALLIPHVPYGEWVFVRILVLCALASLAMILVMGLEDDLAVFDEPDGSRDHPIEWRAVGLAFLTSALATATSFATSALVHYLDRPG
jgi:hypothetical protein